MRKAANEVSVRPDKCSNYRHGHAPFGCTTVNFRLAISFGFCLSWYHMATVDDRMAFKPSSEAHAYQGAESEQ